MAQTEYEVIIKGASNGMIMQIGCKTLVFSTKEIPEAMVDLQTYLTEGYRGHDRMGKKYFPEDFCEKGRPEPVGTGRAELARPVPTDVPVAPGRGRRPRNG